MRACTDRKLLLRLALLQKDDKLVACQPVKDCSKVKTMLFRVPAANKNVENKPCFMNVVRMNRGLVIPLYLNQSS